MLTKEQIHQVKEQLFKQLENWPESQRESAKEQIHQMNDEEFEQFLIKNKMVKLKCWRKTNLVTNPKSDVVYANKDGYKILKTRGKKD